METTTDIRIRKNHLSDGELKKVRQIASKSYYSEKEVKFVLSMAARSIKRIVTPWPAIHNFEIRDEGGNYLIRGK